jgi:hypothetical protein
MREASCALRSFLGVVYEHLLSSGSVLVLYLGCAPLPCRPFVVCLGDGGWGVFDDDETIYVGYSSVLVSDAVSYLVNRQTMQYGPSGLSLAGTRANEKIQSRIKGTTHGETRSNSARSESEI